MTKIRDNVFPGRIQSGTRDPGARRARAGCVRAPRGRWDPQGCARGATPARRSARSPAPRGLARRTGAGGCVYLEAETRAAGRRRRPRSPRGQPCRPPAPGAQARCLGPGSRRPQPSERGPGWSLAENGGRRVCSGWRGARRAWRGPAGGPRDEFGFVSGASRLLLLTF